MCYSEVHVPTDEDNAIKEYIRMRDDQKKMLKSIKGRYWHSYYAMGNALKAEKLIGL